MSSTDAAVSDSPARREREVTFWTLVVLAKVIVLVFGAGVVVLVGTDATLAGVIILGIGMLAAGRWVLLFQRTRSHVGTSRNR